ncbi:hypothetical protein [Virgibacillus dokdonensis]|uniref:Uncharacterized protein n=1 Tax=Virgibacillus dokdonensis TaxID=302167 RepID=A0A2K9J4C8_9BACI|nr:hypothetical protein [Virgibacillus dokdonensis]AUJ26574.1 hypothetical protein A21D_03540 [Virgibacillus dokdonensis]
MNVKFKNYNCNIMFGQYGNGNTAIQLIDEKDGYPVAVATVNGLHKCPNDIVGIKDWSENEGMVDALIQAHVIEDELLLMERTGFVYIGYYKLTDQALKLLKEFKVGQQA